jgi:hypothetical protein
MTVAMKVLLSAVFHPPLALPERYSDDTRRPSLRQEQAISQEYRKNKEYRKK